MTMRAKASGWVLVVGDDATERMGLFRLVELGGHHATVVGVNDAVDQLNEDSFDLVFLDAGGSSSASDLRIVEREAERLGIPSQRIHMNVEPAALQATVGAVLARLFE